MADIDLTFQPYGKRVKADLGKNILQTAREAGININSICGGKGTCGKCKVIIRKGEECLSEFTQKEKHIRSQHQQIDNILAEQNINYTEITTHRGKQLVYEKFNFQNGKHPLFVILNKHPLEYFKGDSLMVIEWGKWKDIEVLKDDLMSLVNFFSNEDFRKSIVDAKDPKMWKKAGQFLEKHGISILSIGAKIAAAIL